MARNASIENAGYYPLPGTDANQNLVAEMIASLIAVPEGARFADLMAGEFAAGTAMCDAWGIPWTHRYANEFDAMRAAKIASLFGEAPGNVLNANMLATLQVAKNMFQVMYSNPPFDNLEAIHEGGRLEPKFFKRITDAQWLQAGGIHILVSPKYVFQRPDMITYLVRNLNNIRVFSLPEEVGPYAGAIIVIGVVRKNDLRAKDDKDAPLSMEERLRREGVLVTHLQGTLRELAFAEKPLYNAPEPKPITKLVWRDRTMRNPRAAITDISKVGGAWSSKAYKQIVEDLINGTVRINPLFPLSPVQAAVRLANGDIDNEVVTLGGESWRIKGSTLPSVQKWKEKQQKGESEIIIEHEVTTEVPIVTLVNQKDGRILVFRNNTGLQKLLEFSDASNIIDTVDKACPPVYNGVMPDWLKQELNRVKPKSGRALPGYTSGLIPMQQHMIAALYLGITEPHRITGADPLVNALLSGEMGAGKTGCAAVLLHLMAQREFKENPNKPYIAAVVGPNTVIGDRKSVQDYYDAISAGKAPKNDLEDISPHLFEFNDWLEDAHIEIIESPAQWSRFVRQAQAGKVNLALFSASKMSLAAGRTVGTHTRFSRGEEPEVIEGAPTPAGEVKQRRWAQFHIDNLAKEMEVAKERKKLARERVFDANGDDEEKAAPVYRYNVSPRTNRRDEMFRAGARGGIIDYGNVVEETRTVHDMATDTQRKVTLVKRNIVERVQKSSQPISEVVKTIPRTKAAKVHYCVRCGDPLLTDKKELHTDETLKKAGFGKRARCQNCSEPFYQANRQYDSVEDRTTPIFSEPSWLTADPDIPWGTRPTSNPRMPLGDFIARRYPGVIDLMLVDEAHMYKGLSDRGEIFGKVVAASKRTIPMTGTIYGGLASTAFWLLKRMGSPTLNRMFDYDELDKFIERLGILDNVTRTVLSRTEGRSVSGKGEKITKTKIERPGITAKLAAIIQECSVITLLKQMGFNLVNYTEDIVPLALPEDIQFDYEQLLAGGIAIIKEPDGHDALGSYLQCALQYPYAPYKEMAISSKKRKESYVPALYSDRIMPHHTWIADYLQQQKAAGQRVLFYVTHTNKLDLLTDIQEKVTAILKERGVDINIAILRSNTVKSTRRKAWLKEQEKKGVDACLCHPQLVEAGVNLLGWPKIVSVEPTYSLYTDNQSKRRAYRPNQTQDCEVLRVCYVNTMVQQALGRIGQKAAGAAVLTGDDLTNSVLVFDESMSLLGMLGKLATGGMPAMSLTDVRTAVQAAGKAVVTQQNDRGLVGVATDMYKVIEETFDTVMTQDSEGEIVPLPEAERVELIADVAKHMKVETEESATVFLSLQELLGRKRKLPVSGKTTLSRKALSTSSLSAEDVLQGVLDL